MTFDGLTNGIYEIKETKTPEGYVTDSDMTIYIRIENGVVTWLDKTTEGSTITWTKKKTNSSGITFEQGVVDDPETIANEAVNAVFTVPNEPGAALPNTGGPGTYLIYMAGAFLVLMGGVVLFLRRRTTR